MKKPALVAIAVFATACAVDPSTPSDHMKIYEGCKQTLCDQYQSSGSSECSACMSACMGASYDCDPSSACDESCSPRECSDQDRSTCVDEGWQVVEANNPDPSILQACESVIRHITDCGYQSPLAASDCERYAANESADVAVPAYQCVAALDCSALGDGSSIGGCDPAPSTFGDDLCGSIASQCPDQACSSQLQTELDADAAWLRPDALDAARSCLSASTCSDTQSCLSTWISAVE